MQYNVVAVSKVQYDDLIYYLSLYRSFIYLNIIYSLIIIIYYIALYFFCIFYFNHLSVLLSISL